ncbi:MAG: hypothetical protein FJ404_11185 [Verrucomicrobia bacterium]|nr:hypothetical protein [Verrucomicrobiota bacterium]
MSARFRARFGSAWTWVQNVLSLWVVVAGVGWGSPGQVLVATLAGLALIGVGGLLGLAGVRSLGSQRTTGPALPPGAILVTRGNYARVRHPLYGGLMLSTLGWSIFWESRCALGAALVLAAVLKRKSMLEEAHLRERFADYAEYAGRVPGFFPKFNLKPAVQRRRDAPKLERQKSDES